MKNNLPKTGLIMLLLSCGFPTVADLRAEDQTTRDLLIRCWSVTQKRDADLLIKNAPNKTATTVWAYALVKVRQHDIAKAMVAIEVLEKMDPNNATTIRLKAWLLLRQSKFDEAMMSVAKVITLIESDKKISHSERQQAYVFAGTIFGFLDGPVAARINHISRDSAIHSVLKKMDTTSQTAFDSAYQRVASKYGRIMNKKQEVDRTAAIQDAKIRQTKFAMLTEKEALLQEAERRLGNERSEFRTSAIESLANLRNQQLHLANQPALFASRVYDHRLGYISHRTSSGGSHDKVRHHRRPRFYDGHLLKIPSQKNTLDRQFHATRVFAVNQINILNQELKEVSKVKQRTAGQKLRALKPTTKSNSQSVAMRNRANSISTYIQFPLEMERQLLLSSIK